jgi:ligand-binding sensor domain-containing protein
MYRTLSSFIRTGLSILNGGKVTIPYILPVLLLTAPALLAQHSDKQVNTFNSKLSSDNIGQMVQDHKGYLWIATDDGLNRYDGYDFTIYKHIPGDSTSLPDNSIHALTVDTAGNVWIGFSNGNISYYQPSTRSFVHINGSESGLKQETVVLIFFDKNGKLWLTMSKNGLFYFDPSLKRFIKAGDLSFIDKRYQINPTDYANYNTIYDIHEDSTGLFWMATHDGLYTYRPGDGKFEVVRREKVVPFESRYDLFSKILPAKDGYWLSGWGGGLTFFNTQTHKWKNYKPRAGDPGTNNIILDLEWKREDQIWIASMDHGFGYFDIQKEKFVFSDASRSRTILKDNRGMVWVGREQQGIIHFDPATLFSFHDVKSRRSDNNEFYFTNTFYHDIPNQLLYYGVSFGDGLHLYNEQTGEEKVYPFDVLNTSEPGLQLSDIYKDKNDSLWILTSDFIYLFDEHRKRLC